MLKSCHLRKTAIGSRQCRAVELVYKDASGNLGNELVLRDREPDLEIVTTGQPWSFDGDGAMLRLVPEAHRIRLAHLFDPLLAVHTSLVEPLPHQITAVYGEMIPRQPLRFLLADDPGAGKTIMAGLLMRELLVRGDLHRCLVVCPGSLAAQWQDELFQKFHLPFEILTALNKPENFVLALVQVPESEDFPEGDAFKVSTTKGSYNAGDNGCLVQYVLNPFQKEPDFKADSVNYNWKELWGQGGKPK